MSTGREIRLVEEDEWWVAEDTDTGVASQGKTRSEALDNLDEAVALTNGEIGESIESPEEERAALRDMEIDPEEVETAREGASELPPFMQ